jgi:uridine phosphorylase
MFALSSSEKERIESTRAQVRRLGLIATDMETATLLTASRVLGARAASLCLGTVDGLTQAKIDASEFAASERDLFEIALDAVTARIDAEKTKGL